MLFLSIYISTHLGKCIVMLEIEFFDVFFLRKRIFSFKGELRYVYNNLDLPREKYFPFERAFNCSRISCVSSGLLWQAEQV